jgi:hypothetical protein
MSFTRVVFEVEDCDDQDEALERIRSGTVEPVEFSVEED